MFIKEKLWLQYVADNIVVSRRSRDLPLFVQNKPLCGDARREPMPIKSTALLALEEELVSLFQCQCRASKREIPPFGNEGFEQYQIRV